MPVRVKKNTVVSAAQAVQHFHKKANARQTSTIQVCRENKHQAIHKGNYLTTINSNKTYDKINEDDFKIIIDALIDDLPKFWEWDDEKNALYGCPNPELKDVRCDVAYEIGEKNYRLHAHLRITYFYFGYGKMRYTTVGDWLRSHHPFTEGWNHRTRGVRGDHNDWAQARYQYKEEAQDRVREQLEQEPN